MNENKNLINSEAERKAEARNCKTGNDKTCKGKTKRSNSRRRKPSNRDAHRETSSAQSEFRNSPDWYAYPPELMAQISNISFDNFMGQPTPQFGSSTISNVPTGLSVYVNPSIGFNDGRGSYGINTQALNLFVQLSGSNGRTTQYAPQDVLTLLLAMGEVISMIEFGRRALGVVFTFNQRNRSFPRGVLATLGFDPDSVTTNIANHKTDLNVLINAFNALPIMTNIPYFEKCRTMYQTYYLDADQPMAAYWAYVPYTTWEIDEISSDQGTVLKTRDVANRPTIQFGHVKWDNYMQRLASMIQSLKNSATYNYIYADMKRLAGETNTAYLDLVSTDYYVLPVYDEMMNLQLHNSQTMPVPSKYDTLGTQAKETFTPDNDVYPDPDNNTLKMLPAFETTSIGTLCFTNNKTLDFPNSKGAVSPEMILEASVYATPATGTVEWDGKTYLANPAIGDHYIVSYEMWINDTSLIGPFGSYIWSGFDNKIFLLSTIHNAPLIYLCDSAQTKLEVVYGELDWWTTLSPGKLLQMHDLATQSIFTIR